MKRLDKKNKRRFSIFILIIIIIISYLGVFVYQYWSKILINYNTKNDLEQKYNKLLNEEEKLKSEVNKLQDPDYVAKFAREKYLYSKDGEYIIKIPNKD